MAYLCERTLAIPCVLLYYIQMKVEFQNKKIWKVYFSPLIYGTGEAMNQETQIPVGFSQLISEHFSQLTKSEKRIASYLNQNQDEAAFLSLARSLIGCN